MSYKTLVDLLSCSTALYLTEVGTKKNAFTKAAIDHQWPIWWICLILKQSLIYQARWSPGRTRKLVREIKKIKKEHGYEIACKTVIWLSCDYEKNTRIDLERIKL